MMEEEWRHHNVERSVDERHRKNVPGCQRYAIGTLAQRRHGDIDAGDPGRNGADVFDIFPAPAWRDQHIAVRVDSPVFDDRLDHLLFGKDVIEMKPVVGEDQGMMPESFPIPLSVVPVFLVGKFTIVVLRFHVFYLSSIQPGEPLGSHSD